MTTPSGPSNELRATPSHLRDLAQKHGDAAAQIGLATNVVDEVAGAVLRTHGTVCSTAATAAEQVAEARKRACIALETTSQAHEANLDTAASQYVATDGHHANSINQQMPTQPR
jgi:hypothetical protein